MIRIKKVEQLCKTLGITCEKNIFEDPCDSALYISLYALCNVETLKAFVKELPSDSHIDYIYAGDDAKEDCQRQFFMKVE